MNSQQELLDAINTITRSKDRSCDTPATVLRVEGDVAWVHIDGGADETPVQKTINCSEGETVQVRISNGSAFLVGNASAPPTDDKTANVAHFVAEQADIKAVKAEETATEVKATVEVLEVEVDEKVDIGTSNIQHLSSTMYQNANGVNIFNDTLSVGDSYAHIDGDSFDIKQATTADTIDDANDVVLASFGREVTVGSRDTGVVGTYSQVFGFNCKASGDYSHAEGSHTEASGDYSHAEGIATTATGACSHAEGDSTEAIGAYSHAEGHGCYTDSDYAHAEGENSSAEGATSHAEGGGTRAVGDYSHAEGCLTVVVGQYSHAQGYKSTATGWYAHSEGSACHANGNSSHAQNTGTIASSLHQTAIGIFNVEDNNNTYALIIGNGTADNARSDALRVKWDGSVIDGSGNKISPTILISTTISSATTSYTFSDASITADSTIEVFDEIDGFEYTTCSASAGSCTITFPAQSTSHKIKLHVW